jgi:hypothetical protein
MSRLRFEDSPISLADEGWLQDLKSLTRDQIYQ